MLELFSMLKRKLRKFQILVENKRKTFDEGKQLIMTLELPIRTASIEIFNFMIFIKTTTLYRLKVTHNFIACYAMFQ